MSEDLSSDLLVNKLTKIGTSFDKITKLIPDISERTTDPELENGISLMQLKNTVLMVHNANLLHLISRKLKGELIKDSSTVDRLIESRVLIERMKPLEVKLKYQMERLLKLTTISESDNSKDKDSSNRSVKGTTEKALSYKPNLSKLMKKSKSDNAGSEIDDADDDSDANDDEDFSDDENSDINHDNGEINYDQVDEQSMSGSLNEDDQGSSARRVSEAVRQSTSRNRAGLERAKEHLRQKKAEKGGGKYVPPKLVPMPYNHYEESKSKREEQRAFMKRYNSSVMRELREEFSEAPQEYSEMAGGQAAAAKYRKVERIMKERQEHEEEFMTRLPPIKNLKKMRQVRGLSEIDSMVGALGSLKGKMRSKHSKSSKGGKRFGGGGKRKFKRR